MKEKKAVLKMTEKSGFKNDRKKRCRFDVCTVSDNRVCCRIDLDLVSPVISYSVLRKIYRSCGSFDFYIYDPLFLINSNVSLDIGGVIPVYHSLSR